MKKVDATIEAICDWIQIELKETGNMQKIMLLPEMVKALAALVAARAETY